SVPADDRPRKGHRRPGHAGKRRGMRTRAMNTKVMAWVLFGACATFSTALMGHAAEAPPAKAFRLDAVDGLEVVNGSAEAAAHQGRPAIRLVSRPGHETPRDAVVAILPATDFADGTIEADVAGAPRPIAPPDARGFIGIAFRVQPHAARYECFYLRPSNG